MGGGGGGKLSVVLIINKGCGNQHGCALVFSLFIHFFFDLDSNTGCPPKMQQATFP